MKARDCSSCRKQITDEQLNFIQQMSKRYGCNAGIARSVHDALRLVGETW